MRLAEDATGLATEIDPPDTQLARDVVALIDRGDVSGMSISFNVRRSDTITTTETDGVTVIDAGGERITIRREGDRTIEERELLDVDVYDVSPVTFPQYPQTDVSIRSRAEPRDRPPGPPATPLPRPRAAPAPLRLGRVRPIPPARRPPPAFGPRPTVRSSPQHQGDASEDLRRDATKCATLVNQARELEKRAKAETAR